MPAASRRTVSHGVRDVRRTWPRAGSVLAAMRAGDELSALHRASAWFLASQLVVELTRCSEGQLGQDR
jgi:hypothetical protein